MRRIYLSLFSPLAVLGCLMFPAIAHADITPITPDESLAIESQVTSVSQLSDVQPTDWAFQALQSLVERYGCIVGYPDKTYRGDRALTRYEFAAGLNACLDKIQELITAATADLVKKEDLETVKKLQEEFAAELATLRGRVDALETRTATLEKQQFSTTTKLSGQALFAINGGTQANADDPNITFFYRARLNLATSFSGKDTLLTQLQAGNGNSSDAAGFLQQENGIFRNRLVQIGEAQIQQQFERIFFPLNELGLTLEDLGIGLANLQTVEDVRDAYAGIVRTLSLEEGASPETALSFGNTLLQGIETGRIINRFLQANSALDYSNNVTSGLSVNRLSYTFPVGKDLQLSFFPQAYLSDFVDRNSYANNSATNFSTYGLINNQLLLAGDIPGAGAAFAWNPGQGAFTFRAAYRAEQVAFVNTGSIFGDSGDRNGIFNSPNLGVVELEIAPSKTVALRLQYSRGTQAGSDYSALGANFDLALGKHLGLFGRFGYAFDFPGGIQAIAWSAGLAFPDLLGKGNLAGISVGQPLRLQDDVLGLFNGTQTNYEVFYRIQVSDNIAISPIFQVITNPGNAKTDTVFTATLRTLFSF
jgi:Carbohydrate-selective porin, OprB family/S-layer homology domain